MELNQIKFGNLKQNKLETKSRTWCLKKWLVSIGLFENISGKGDLVWSLMLFSLVVSHCFEVVIKAGLTVQHILIQAFGTLNHYKDERCSGSCLM